MYAAEGYEALFDDEVLSEVRSSEAEAGEGIGQAPQPLRVRVLVAGDPSRPSRVRVQPLNGVSAYAKPHFLHLLS